MNLQRKTIVSLLLVCVSIFTGCAKMDLKADRFTLELGEDPADYASQYVSVKGADLEDVNFDFSKVNTDKVGEYQATAKLKKKTKEFMLEVKDTTAPKITLKKDIQIQAGEALEITDVIAKVTEKSKEVTVKYSDQEHVIKNEKKKISGVSVQAEVLQFDAEGAYEENLTVSDAQGNEKKYSFTVSVEKSQAQKAAEETQRLLEEQQKRQAENNSGISQRTNAGDWVAELSVAQQTNQLIVVAARGTSATISMHTKDANGIWQQNLETSGFVGSGGVGQASEYASCSPRGVWGFSRAFGNMPNPGTALVYTQVDDSYYWVDDVNSVYYNQFVSTNEVVPDWNSAEHISACGSVYNYVLALDYNAACVPGNGSAFFLHCSNGRSTAGCVSVPQNAMVQIMQTIQPGCLIIIDTADGVKGY